MGGPATLPILPLSEVPRAKMTVKGVQPLLSETSFAVDPPVYLVAPPVEDPPPVAVGEAAMVFGPVAEAGLVLVRAAGAVVVLPGQKYLKPKIVHVARLSSWSAGIAAAAVTRARAAKLLENFILKERYEERLAERVVELDSVLQS